MTFSRQEILESLTVTTPADLVLLWTSLLGDQSFGRRTVWLVLLDDDGRPLPTVVPVDDLPLVPSPADVESFRRFLDHLEGYGTPVLLLSRPGPGAVQDHDRQWERVLAPAAPRWPLHLATTDASGRCAVVPLLGPADGGGS